MGRPGQTPPAPLNLVGDFGGGAMMLALGICAALLEAQRSGKGQVVDAAMTDGAAALMAIIYGLKAAGVWTNNRGANLLDGGAHFYDTYECADGKYVAIGAIEPQFYALLLEKTGITDPDFNNQMDKAAWPALKQKLAAIIKTKTRDQWAAIMENTDICFAPVLDLDEAPQHPHNQARNTFITIDGVSQPAPAPRFARTPSPTPTPPPQAGQHTESILKEAGLTPQEIQALRTTGAI